MNYKYFVVALLAAWLFACKAPQQTTTAVSSVTEEKSKAINPVPKPYRAANTIVNDIVHTELKVKFDWEKHYLYGQATLTIRPYFYPLNHLYLNARGMEIKEISILKNNSKTPLKYNYENDSLKIELDKKYTRNEEYKIFIDYVSKPDELKEVGGSAAITSDKGLYFINADGKDPNKPRQLWTQGETQASSVWFPTIDSPNERFTQEIYITVDTFFVTLSNGLLINSTTNKSQGTRTDYWKQSLPHAPYLAMMAISDFKVVKDKWRNIEVSYYVDTDYEKYAKAIFGNTPEVMEFFSKKLGVDYVWEKYSQVVVHDYVSGAMENTSATLHGEFLQRDDRALLDETNEDVISHELFHQWFGDLVTCESWSNISQNESFATYGEYLWNEYKYGQEEADYGLMRDLDVYLRQSKSKNVSLIRFEYEAQEEVFDGISYQKGGRILHMLRKYLGDEAFFEGLKLYLSTNKFKPVESHHLRLAMEEVCGKDLNWFFNQWYFDKGHPDLDISYEWVDSSQIQVVIIEQKQDFEKNPLFKIPLSIDIYIPEGITRHEVVCNKMKETFFFKTGSRPMLVNVDADKVLVCTKKDNKSKNEWAYQFNHAPLLLDRYEAVQKLSKSYKVGTIEAGIMLNALDDKMWAIRNLAIKNIGVLAKNEDTKEEIKNRLVKMAQSDAKSAVRASALQVLSKNYEDTSMTYLYEQAVNDRSYDVMDKAINIIADMDEVKGLEIAKRLEREKNKNISRIVAGIYTEYGKEENFEFMKSRIYQTSGGSRYQATLNYAKFLSRCRPSTIEGGLDAIIETAKNGSPWYVKLAGMQALSELSKTCEKRASENASDTALSGRYSKLREDIEWQIKTIKGNEKDKNLVKIWGEGGD